MKYYTLAPPPALRRYVRFYWILEHDVAADNPYFHRTLADGCVEMVFHYKGRFDQISGNGRTEHAAFSGINGPTRYFRRFTIAEDFGIFVIYLYPFALPALFNIPTTAITNEMPDCSSLLGEEGVILEERMILAQDHAARRDIINAYLLEKLRRAPSIEPGVFSVISNIIDQKGISTVSEIAAQNAISMRQLERNFKAFSGFSPKLFNRIIRFQSAIEVYGNKSKSLTEIAFDCGYYDQSHFIHDFKEFTGQHPKTYFSGGTDATEYRDA